MAYRFNNFYEMLQSHAVKRGNKTAIFFGEEKFTYRDFLEKVDRLASFFVEKGVVEGDKVALFLRNSPEFLFTLFALSKLGAIAVPINTFLKEDELDYILEDSGAKALVASTLYEKIVVASGAYKRCDFLLWKGEKRAEGEKDSGFEEAFATKVATIASPKRLDETAVIIYTSGTTGKPKGAMLSHRNIFSNMISGQKTINVKAKDRSIVFLPMFHSFTLSISVMVLFYVGGSIVIIQSIQPFSNIFKQVLTKRVTLFFGIPDVYNALAKAKLPWYFMWFNRIRAFCSGAAPLQAKTLDAMAKKFRRATLLEGYGLSEASPAVCMNTFKKQKVGSVGTALYGYEMKIVDEQLNELDRGMVGDIIVKGDNVMQGYLKRPEATEETIVNGWLLTGDMGYMDDEGFLFIVDRKKDLIISKGINIYPREIEEVIDRFEGVVASAVIGIADERSGEIPIVYLELEEGQESLDEKALKGYLREHLANYKIPKQIHYVKELPKNATGKVLKRLLKERLAYQAQ
jgi:long-chain acyl-CoA synthetase